MCMVFLLINIKPLERLPPPQAMPSRWVLSASYTSSHLFVFNLFIAHHWSCTKIRYSESEGLTQIALERLNNCICSCSDLRSWTECDLQWRWWMMSAHNQLWSEYCFPKVSPYILIQWSSNKSKKILKIWYWQVKYVWIVRKLSMKCLRRHWTTLQGLSSSDVYGV